MKLGAAIFGFSALVALAATGCAASCPAVPAASTTQLTSADVQDTESAPLVGKAQHASSRTDSRTDDALDVKDGRRAERHVGGGFSGYK